MEVETMKYDCSQEFDLVEIYRKLTQPIEPVMVKASVFFTQEDDDNLYRMQELGRKVLAEVMQARTFKSIQ